MGKCKDSHPLPSRGQSPQKPTIDIPTYILYIIKNHLSRLVSILNNDQSRGAQKRAKDKSQVFLVLFFWPIIALPCFKKFSCMRRYKDGFYLYFTLYCY